MKSSVKISVDAHGGLSLHLFLNESRVLQTVRRMLRCALLSTLLLYSLIVLCPVRAEERYRVNGRTVPRNVYDAALLVSEANAHIAGGRVESAIYSLRRAISYDPEFAGAQTNLGILLAKKGCEAEALEHLKKAIACPDCPSGAYANLASLYQSMGDLDRAIATYQQFVSLNPEPDQMKQVKATISLLEAERTAQRERGFLEPVDYFPAKDSGEIISRWPVWRMPLRVFIEPASSVGPYDKLLKDAFHDWQEASSGVVSFRFVQSIEDSDIDCRWTDDSSLLGSGSENGNTEIANRGILMKHARILLQSSAGEGSLPFSEGLVLSTCRHEVGHALGISWHSAKPADVMYYSVPISDKGRKITSRDINTLIRLYSGPMISPAACLDFLNSSENQRKYGALVPVSASVFMLLLLLNYMSKKNRKRIKRH